MYLFIDTISEPGYLALFDEKRDIISEYRWQARQKEFDTLIETIDEFLSTYGILYKDLSGVICINGPGSFTGTRIATLVVNTIGYSYGVPLFPISVGQFLSLQSTPFPWILPMTKREILLWENDSEHYEVKLTHDLPIGQYFGMVFIDLPSSQHTIVVSSDYESVIRRISLAQYTSIIHPIYGKSPNITLS